MLKLISKIFGTKSEKDIKKMMPLVELTKKEGEQLTSVSHDQLREKTSEVQHYINSQLKSIDDQIASLHARVSEQTDMDIHEKESVFAEIDKLESQRNKDLD
jgi:preprotein translocase subunit SecA